MERFSQTIESLAEARNEGKGIADAVSNYQYDALEQMKESKETSVIVTSSKGDRLKATMVQPSRAVWDEDGIMEKVGKENCTERVFSRKVLEEAIAKGKVEAADIAPFMTEKPGTAFVKVT